MGDRVSGTASPVRGALGGRALTYPEAGFLLTMFRDVDKRRDRLRPNQKLTLYIGRLCDVAGHWTSLKRL